MKDFEIRLHRADGAISIAMAVNAHCPYDAKAQADQMLKDDIA
jgi:hypothetical protein